MTVNRRTGVRELVARAESEIEVVPAEEVLGLAGDPGALLVDLRDVRELQRDGRIPGAFHMPRGMVEFWVDPQSPYFKEVFAEDRRFVFFCNKGWRSALATKAAQDVGLERAAHMDGGFEAWVAAGGAIEKPPPQK